MPEVGSLFVRLRADASEFEQTLKSASDKLKNVGSGMQDIGRQFSVVGAGVAAVGGMAIKASIDYESAFAGVKKTVDATDEQLAALSAGIRQMATEIPASATAIAAVGEAAGQLGIQTDNILGFSRVMIDLGEATNLSADQAATALARFANIVQMPQDQFDRLGSVIVELGNNLATTEADIVGMGMGIAGAGHQVGLTEAQIMGFAGALSSVGIEAQAGGTAISKVFIELASNVATGGAKLGDFAQVAGMSASQFQTAFKEDAAGATISFIEGLHNISAAGGNVFGVLDDLGLSEVRVRDALLRASGAGDLFRSSIELGSKAWEENTALSNEAAQRYATTASQLQIMRNRLVDVAIQLGDVLLPIVMNAVIPAFQAFMERISGVIDWFSGLSDHAQRVIVAIGAIVVAIGPVLFGLGTFISVLGAVVSVLAVVLSPIGLLVAAVAALALAFATDFQGIRTAVMDAIMPIITVLTEQLSPAFDALTGVLSDLMHGDLAGAAAGLSAVWDALASADWGAIGAVVWGALGDIGAALSGLAGDIYGWVSGQIAAVDWAGLGQSLLGYASTAWGALGDLASLALDLAGALSGWISEQVGKVDWAGLATSIWRGLGVAVGMGADIVVDVATTIHDWLSEQIGKVDWPGLANDIIAGIGTGLSAATGFGETVAGWIGTQLAGVDWGGLGTTIADGLSGALGSVKDFGAQVDGVNQLADGLGRLADAAGRIAPWAGGIAAVVATLALLGPITAVVTAVAGAVSTLVAIVIGLSGAIALVGGPIALLAAVLNPVGLIVAALAVAIGVLAAAFIGNWFGIRDAVMAAVAPILANLQQLWSTLSTQLQPLLAQLRELWAALGPAIEVVKIALIAIGAVLGGVLLAALMAVVTALSGLLGFFVGALPGAIQVVTGVIQILTGVIEAITAVVVGFVKIVFNLLTGDWVGAWNAAQEMVGKVAEAIGTILSGLKDVALGLILGLVGGIVGAVSGFVESVIGFFTGLYHALVGGSIIPDMVNGIIEWIGKLPGEVLEFISGMVTDVLAKMGEFAGDMLAKGQEVVQNVIDGMTGLLESVKGAAGDIVRGITGKFSDALTLLSQAGRDIVQGLIDGITGMITAAGDAIGSVGGAIKGRIKGMFGISSPSKVMADIGQDTILGLALGMSKTEQEAVKAASDVAKGVIDTLGAALDLAGRLGSFRGEINIPAVDRLIDLSHRVVDGMAGIAQRFDDDLMKQTKEAATALKDSFGALSDAVDFAQKLAAERVILPGNEVVSDLKFWAEHAVRSLGDSGAYLGTGLMDASKAFAGAMTDTFGALGDAVAFARDVATQRVVLPSNELISDLKFMAEHAVRSLGDSGAYVGSVGMQNAIAFADALKASIGALGDAVGFSREVAKSEVVLPSNDLISDLKFMSEHVVQSLGDSGAYVGSAGMDNAKRFSDAMKAAFSGLGEAVKFSLAVMDTKIVQPSRALITRLALTAADVVIAMGKAADQLGPQLLASAEKAGAGVKSAFDSIGASLTFVVDVAAAMKDGVIQDVPRALVDMLAALAAAVVEAFAAATARFETEVLEAVEDSSGAVKAVLDVFSAAVAYVKTAAELEEKEGAPGAATALTGALTTLIVGIVDAFVAASARMQTQALAAAKAFADSIKPLVDLVSPIVQAAKAITDMSEITEKQMGIFTGNVGKIATVIQQASGLADDARRSAEEFARNAQDTLHSVQAGVAALYAAANIAASAPTVTAPPAPSTAEVPAMAKGGVVDRPTLALIGESARATPEIVAPEPVLRGVLRDEMGKSGPGGDGLTEAIRALRAITRDLQRALRGALVVPRAVMGDPRATERLIQQVSATMDRLAGLGPQRVDHATLGAIARADANNTPAMIFNVDQIVATDRREAERGASDLAWGVRARLRARGVS